MVIHDEILSSGGSNWHDWRAFNPDWYASPAAPVFRRRILEVLRRDFGNSRLFVIKDPRICRFWPLWRDVLEEFGAKPGVVIPVRNPLEVMASLKRRDGFVSAKSCLIWLRHVVDAESATRGLPRAVVTYRCAAGGLAKCCRNARVQTGGALAETGEHRRTRDRAISCHASFATTPSPPNNWLRGPKWSTG